MESGAYNEKLQAEREKLNRLIDEALENGTHINETFEIAEQCRKVNKIINDSKKEKTVGGGDGR
jgi:hypothetical protein